MIVMNEELREQALRDIVRGLRELGYTAEDKAEISSLFAAVLRSDEPYIACDAADLVVTETELGI